jgi:threonine/homoserine/homoserine lactone efflux protein
VGSLLTEVLPLAAGAAISPAILTLQLLTLAKGGGALKRSWFIAAGAGFVLLVEAVLAVTLAESTGGSGTTPDWKSAVKLAAAVALVLFGIRSLTKTPAPPKEEDAPEQAARAGRSFGLGVVLMATNVTTLALYFPMVHEIGTDGAGLGAKVATFAIAFAIVMIPAAGPPLAVAALGRRGQAGLQRLNAFVTAHHAAINATVCFLFALVLGVPALQDLL